MMIDHLKNIIMESEMLIAELEAEEEITECSNCTQCRSCLVCKNFNEEKELCKLYNQRPPVRIIVNGCEKFEDKDQPDEQPKPLYPFLNKVGRNVPSERPSFTKPKKQTYPNVLPPLTEDNMPF